MRLQVSIDKFAFDLNVIFANQEFFMESGQVVAIIGANGTGKSTLVNMMNGKLKSSVRMSCDGQTLIPGVNDTIVFIADDFIGLEYLTPKEAAQYFLLLYGKSFDMGTFREELAFVHLDEAAASGQVIKNLSKGTKQKVIFMIYMMLDKDIILFDEGLENIDESTLSKIMTRLASWARGERKLCIIATHSRLILSEIESFLFLSRLGHDVNGTTITSIHRNQEDMNEGLKFLAASSQGEKGLSQ